MRCAIYTGSIAGELRTTNCGQRANPTWKSFAVLYPGTYPIASTLGGKPGSDYDAPFLHLPRIGDSS
jgi:hypothetical protein